MILIMQERVRDYDAWKAVFDDGEALRAKHGCTGHEIFRSDDDGNDLTVHLHFPSREAADAFLADPEPAANMRHAGVETQPAQTRVREGESLKYTGRRAAWRG
jgi:quinol monooxygenase YgiN